MDQTFFFSKCLCNFFFTVHKCESLIDRRTLLITLPIIIIIITICRTSTNQDEAIPEPVQPLEIEPSRINHHREDAKTITRVASTTLNNNFILIDGQVSVNFCCCFFLWLTNLHVYYDSKRIYSLQK